MTLLTSFRALGGAALLLVAAAGCGDGATGPAGFGGRFALRSANGRALPATVAAFPAGDRYEVVGGVLVLGPRDSSVVLVVTTRYVDQSGRPYPAVADSLVGRYRTAGLAVTVSPPLAGTIAVDGPVLVQPTGAVRVALQRPVPPSYGFATYAETLLYAH